MKKDGLITVTAQQLDDCVKISIKDNGKGIDDIRLAENKSKSLKFSGIGLENVTERIHLHFGEAYGLSVHSIPGEETTITLTLPKSSEEVNL